MLFNIKKVFIGGAGEAAQQFRVCTAILETRVQFPVPMSANLQGL